MLAGGVWRRSVPSMATRRAGWWLSGRTTRWGAAGAGSAWRRTAFGWRVRAMLAEIGADHRVVGECGDPAGWSGPVVRRLQRALSAVGVVVVDHAGLMAVAGGWAGDGVHLSGPGIGGGRSWWRARSGDESEEFLSRF